MAKTFEHNFDIGRYTVFSDKPAISNLIYFEQIHSNKVIEFRPGKDIPECDGIVFSQDFARKYSFAIKTADCLPILLFGSEKVAFVHAGWRGLANNILANKLILAIDPKTAYIGPSISVKNFIVTPDFRENFKNSSDYFENNKKLKFNLQAEAIKQLNTNFPGIDAINCAQCTFDNEQYNSYRRDKTDKRNWNIFSI
jgi:YfiH family protein